MDIYNPVYPGLYYFDTFTFTTLGTSGHRGPDSTKTYANAPWREGDFSIVNGQQQWTVPATGTYRITAAGAYSAKKGRVVSGDVILNEGQVVSLLVGQTPFPSGFGLGGGGGSIAFALRSSSSRIRSNCKRAVKSMSTSRAVCPCRLINSLLKMIRRLLIVCLFYYIICNARFQFYFGSDPVGWAQP